jgi:glycerol-3-phosphate dehydrogenase subunit B
VNATRAERCDVAIVGAGMAGMAAALFASREGLSCIQVGNPGGLLFASGLLDLLAIHPARAGAASLDPFAVHAALARDVPDHPLARVDAASIRDAFAAFLGALAGAGLRYAVLPERNRSVATSLGTIKTTYALPRTMAAGADALASRPACLIVGIRGLREFSARQFVAAFGDRWPGLRHAEIDLPGAAAAPELYAAHVARGLEAREARDRTIALVRAQQGDARAVGLPAVLGLARADDVHAAFEAALGVPVFEIPTMPTSVPGLRLLGALEAAVAARGVRRYPQAQVRALAFDTDGNDATLELDGAAGPGGRARVTARAVVLATGRFAGRGLVADRSSVREAILGLPVAQPAARADWHRPDFLDPAGHPINRAGLEVDDVWRPLDARGEPAWRRLFAVGSILARQDWMREKCGTGLAVATAWAAVGHLSRALRSTPAG